MLKLKDIAQRAGCSVSTVSRVLSDKDTKAASDEVKAKIWSIIRETGYTPNTDARNLRKRHVVKANEEKKYYACVFARSVDYTTDLFFSELVQVIEAEAYKRNYILRFKFYSEELTKPDFNKVIAENQIRGIIVLGRFGNEATQRVLDSLKNVIYVGLNYPQTQKHEVIFCDGYTAAQSAVSYLLKLGHKRIAYLGECRRENRYVGYCDVLKSSGIGFDHQLVVTTMQSVDGGYRGAKELLNRGIPFSAIFCANDITAIGAMKALKDENIRVPEQISVISIDDITLSRYFTPMLTTIHIPIAELGKEAANRMIDRIEQRKKISAKMELPHSLSVRESCAPYKETQQEEIEKGE